MKRIIVEGMDSTGKSTLIAALCEQFHSLEIVVNYLGPEQDFEHWWGNQLATDISPYTPIHDRFFYSELVYGKILRGYVKASGPVIRETQRRLRNEALLIYCRPRTDTILATFDNQPQMEGVADNQIKLLREYGVIMSEEAPHYGARFIWYNYQESDLREIIARTERYLIGDTWTSTTQSTSTT